MGVVNGWGSGKLLVDLVGPKMALQLLLTCQKIDCELALEYGLCDKLIETDTDAVKHSRDWLEDITSKLDVKVLQAVKKVTQNGFNNASRGLSEILQTEREVFSTVWGAEANLQAIGKKLKH